MPRKGYRLSEEHKKLISESMKKLWQDEEYRARMTASRKGKKRSEETRRKISIGRLGENNPMYGKHFHHSDEAKRKISTARKNTQSSVETKKLISANMKKLWQDKEYRAEMTASLTGRKFSEVARAKMSIAAKGKKMSDETKAKMSESQRKLWQNPEHREKQICSILKGLSENRPTSLEQQMIEIIEKHGLPYKYTGDGSVLIGYKNPDFVNVNGDKICIEVGNSFFHDDEYEEERKKHFFAYGWQCIVFITDDKLDEEEVLKKLENETNNWKKL